MTTEYRGRCLSEIPISKKIWITIWVSDPGKTNHRNNFKERKALSLSNARSKNK